MIKKMKDLKPKVDILLRKNPRCRDSDSILFATMYFIEIGEVNLKNMNGFDLLKIISEDRLPSYDTIARVRRKLQNEDETLRGESYNERHKLETEVRTNIGQL